MSVSPFPLIVAGAGPAGFGAALAAARQGLRPLLLERQTCIGGMAGAGLLGFLGPLDNAGRDQKDWSRFRLDREGKPYTGALAVGERTLGGIPEELVARLEKRGAAERPRFGYIPVDCEALKQEQEQMLEEAGVTILYHAQVCAAALRDDGTFKLTVALKEGLAEWVADRVIDATGDGDLAARLGAEFKQGRDGDGACQAATLVFRIGNVKTDPLDFLPDSPLMPEIARQGEEDFRNGRISFNPNGAGCMSVVPGLPGVFTVNQQHTFAVDGTRSADLTRALVQGRKEIRELVAFYRRAIPGCEECVLLASAMQLGVRETRRITGDYVLTRDDVLGARKFSDAICRYAYNLDLHLPPPEDEDEPEDGKWYEASGRSLRPGDWYEIPYRCLLPKGLENVLVAGRCISGTHEAMSSYRLMTSCMAIGQAAGAAMALAQARNLTPRQLDVKVLQQALRATGAIV